ncbi:MAG: PEGA domain-containing protein [Bacteroidales bacterium]
MKQTTKLLVAFLTTTTLFASCASSTLIQTNVNDAKLYLNNEYVGNAPYTMSDTAVEGYTTAVRIEKEGYETLNAFISKNEKVDVIIGGCFVLVPFLWTMKYKPVHNYMLSPLASTDPEETISTQTTKLSSLKLLKELLDEGVLTEEEDNTEKAKTLNQ